MLDPHLDDGPSIRLEGGDDDEAVVVAVDVAPLEQQCRLTSVRAVVPAVLDVGRRRGLRLTAQRVCPVGRPLPVHVSGGVAGSADRGTCG